MLFNSKMQQLPLDTCDKICEFLQPADARRFVEATDANWVLYRAHYMKEFLKKRIRSMQYTQYDSLSNPRKRDKYATVRLLLEMTYGPREKWLYSFDSYWLNGTLDNVIVPSILLDITQNMIKSSTAGTYVCYNFNRPGGDIAKGFIIRGKNISKIRISFGGQIAWEQHYDGKDLLWLQPFKCGISYIPFGYVFGGQNKMEITADTIDSIKVKGLYIDTDDRRRMQQKEYLYTYYSPVNLETGARLYTKYNLIVDRGGFVSVTPA